jgi:predicted nucleic acid-binding Zn ribbon protein
MNCKNCGTAVPKEEINCPSCGTIAAQSKADLQKTDPRMSMAIAWTLVGMGLAGLVFVIANSWTDWYSGLDYVAPVVLIVVGGISLLVINKKAKV